MRDKILYHLATARTYAFLSKAMGSSYYKAQCKKEMQLARLLINQYDYRQDYTVFVKLVA